MIQGTPNKFVNQSTHERPWKQSKIATNFFKFHRGFCVIQSKQWLSVMWQSKKYHSQEKNLLLIFWWAEAKGRTLQSPECWKEPMQLSNTGLCDLGKLLRVNVNPQTTVRPVCTTERKHFFGVLNKHELFGESAGSSGNLLKRVWLLLKCYGRMEILLV